MPAAVSAQFWVIITPRNDIHSRAAAPRAQGLATDLQHVRERALLVTDRVRGRQRQLRAQRVRRILPELHGVSVQGRPGARAAHGREDERCAYAKHEPAAVLAETNCVDARGLPGANRGIGVRPIGRQV